MATVQLSDERGYNMQKVMHSETSAADVSLAR